MMKTFMTYYTIDQFKDFKFSDVSVTGGFSDTDEEKFDSITRTFDEIANNGFADAATTTRINVPPRGEIRVRKTDAHQDLIWTTLHLIVLDIHLMKVQEQTEILLVLSSKISQN